MKKTFVDTFCVVASVNKHNEFHEKANELVLEYDDQSPLTTDAALLEIGNSPARNNKEKSIEIIGEILSGGAIEIVRLDESLFGKSFNLYKTRADQSCGSVDCVSFVVMREHGIADALTRDRHFVQAGFRALMLDAVN